MRTRDGAKGSGESRRQSVGISIRDNNDKRQIATIDSSRSRSLHGKCGSIPANANGCEMISKSLDPLVQLISPQIAQALIEAGFLTNPQIPSKLAAPDGEVSSRHLDLEARLTRQQTAAALTEAGFPTTDKTFSTKASRGGGPPYELWCGRATYQWGKSLSWAQNRLSAPRRSTSEADVISARTAQSQPRERRRFNMDTSAKGDASLSDVINEPQTTSAGTATSPLRSQNKGRPMRDGLRIQKHL